MKTVLLVALGVLAGLFLFLVVAYWFIKRKLKKLFSELGDAFSGLTDGFASLPTYRIKLEPAPAKPWHHPEQVAVITNRLIDLGFKDAGTYVMDHTDSIMIRGMVHPGDSIIAAIYDTNTQEPTVDLVRNTVSGTHVLASNAKTQNLDQPDWCLRENEIDADVDRLLVLLRGLDNRGPFQPFAIEDFVAVFEADYAREMDWRVDRGGYTEQEVQRLTQEASASLDPEDKLANQLSQMSGQMMIAALAGSLEKHLREAFLQQSSMPALEWEKIEDRICIIHKLTDESTLSSNLFQLLDQPRPTGDTATEDGHDEEEKYDPRYDAITEKVSESITEIGPRETFKLIAAGLPRFAEMKALATLTTPSACDVYLMPEGEDD